MYLELVAVLGEQTLPAPFEWYERITAVGRLRLLVRHLEKEQERDLLGVGHIRQAVVAQDVGVGPGLVDYLLGVVSVAPTIKGRLKVHTTLHLSPSS